MKKHHIYKQISLLEASIGTYDTTYGILLSIEFGVDAPFYMNTNRCTFLRNNGEVRVHYMDDDFTLLMPG